MAWTVVVTIHERSQKGYTIKIVPTEEKYESCSEEDERREEINKNGYKDYDVVRAYIDIIENN